MNKRQINKVFPHLRSAGSLQQWWDGLYDNTRVDVSRYMDSFVSYAIDGESRDDGRFDQMKKDAHLESFGFPVDEGFPNIAAAFALVEYSEAAHAFADDWEAKNNPPEGEETYYEVEEEEEYVEYDRRPLVHALIPAHVLAYVDEEACDNGHSDAFETLSSVPENATLVDVIAAFYAFGNEMRLEWFVYNFTMEHGLAEGQLERIQAAVPRLHWFYDGVLRFNADICRCGDPECGGGKNSCDYSDYLTHEEWAAFLPALWG